MADAESAVTRSPHASIGVTLDTYSHVLPSLQNDAANAFDTLFPDRAPVMRKRSKPDGPSKRVGKGIYTLAEQPAQGTGEAGQPTHHRQGRVEGKREAQAATQGA